VIRHRFLLCSLALLSAAAAPAYVISGGYHNYLVVQVKGAEVAATVVKVP
jgi:hypothetical protein